jgi:hypothetical protein
MQDETPAQEAETSAAPSVSEIFSQRHQAMSAHEPHREVGAAPSDEEEVAPAAAEARAADQFRSFASEFQLGHKLNYSADRLIERHGEDTLDEVREWLISKAGPDGSNPMESWAMAQRDPWSAAHQQMQRERLAEEIGSDPEAYKRKLREEWEREQAEKQAEPAAEPAARTTMTPQRPPPPAPASQARSAQPRDDGGRFAGPAPLKFKNRF